jgi:hypothetical protein
MGYVRLRIRELAKRVGRRKQVADRSGVNYNTVRSGVLLIDEVYGLSRSESGNDFGSEAMKTFTLAYTNLGGINNGVYGPRTGRIDARCK